MKYLVVGGSGFLGRSLIKYLLDQGEEVIAISRGRNDLCSSIELDISKSEQFVKLKHVKADIILNCASKLPEPGKDITDPEFVEELFLTNIVGGLNVANFAINNNIRRIINCSTLSVNDKPWPVPLSEEYLKLPTGTHCAYGLSKLSQEIIMNEAVADKNIHLLHLRLSALYGNEMSHQGILFHLLKRASEKESIKVTDSKKTSFDFLHVGDLSMIIHQLSLKQFSSETINVASGKPITLYELTELILKLSNSTNNFRDEETNRIDSFSQIDTSRLKEYLGTKFMSQFKPIEIGLSNLIESLR